MNKKSKIIAGGAGIAALVVTGALLLNQPTPNTNCGFPAPLRAGLNAVAYSGERIGSQCFVVPEGMAAIIIPEPYDFKPCPEVVAKRAGNCIKQVDDKLVALMSSEPGWKYR